MHKIINNVKKLLTNGDTHLIFNLYQYNVDS